MKFIGIWFNMDQEVKRDIVDARDSSEASEKINSMYGANPPASCLTIIPENSSITGNDMHGFSMQSQW